MNTKSEIRTKPQFSWYRAYSKDAPSQTQLLFQSHSDAVNHLKLLRMSGYKNLMLQKVVEAYGEYAYDRPQRHTEFDNWRYVYGTKDNLWHLVGPADRDYATGLTTEEMHRLGPAGAKARYLSPALIGAKRNPASGIPLWLWITGAGLTAGGIYWYYKSKKE